MTAPENLPQGERNASRPANNRLHPHVYSVVIALSLWFALAVWCFAGGGIVDYLLFIVCGVVFVALVLPYILSWVGRSDQAVTESHPPSFRDWATSDYDTWAGRLRGAEAATQIVLPIAAAAIGMTVIGLLYFVAGHAA